MVENADGRFAGQGLAPNQMARASLHPNLWGHKPHLAVPDAAAIAAAVYLPAIVNDGRWLIQCPSCLSAQYASKTDRRFYCGECGNSDHGGMWVATLFPGDDTVVADIETVLNARPRHNQNWRPGQSVADLIVENDLHHIPVPDDVRKRNGLD